ncbi:MAG TPA: efflux RND transporter periplasmic adaptor subunit [Verrucomicrobiae bacterium]
MTAPDKSGQPVSRPANGRHRTRRWLPYLGAVVLLALIIAGLWPKPVPVEVARAEVGTLRATVNEEGKTRIKQRYVVSAPVTGQLRRIPFKAGAEVMAGQTVVAVIDPVAPTLLDLRTRAAAEARRDSAAANLEKNRSTHNFAASELKRFERLFAEKTVSVQELEAAQMRESSATKEQAAAESALRQAEAELAEFGSGSAPPTRAGACPLTEVKAPSGGRVLRVFEENSRVVTAGTPLVEIGDPADLEVVVEVLSRDGAAIPVGAKVELEQWGGGPPLLGRVRLVEPAAFTKVSALGVEEQRVNVIADLTTPPEQRRNVGDAFRVEAKIVTWEAADALKVPVGALFRQGDEWATFVLEDGCARLRKVKTGRSSGTETQVLEGLKPGDQVILYPGSRVHAGQRARPIQI